VPLALNLLAERVKSLIALDATSLAVKAGSALAVNMVMLGALAGSGANPIPVDLFRRVIREKTKKQFADMNLLAFESGLRAAASRR